jgi:hypothetical protein
MIPWNKETDINLSSNEYEFKANINRVLSRLLDNDNELYNDLNSNIDRATSLPFATWDQVYTLDPSDVAISPSTYMALSATDEQMLLGIETGDTDKFITPDGLNNLMLANNIVPKLCYVDITYRNACLNFYQIKELVVSELDDFVPIQGTTMYIRCKYAHITPTSSSYDETDVKKLEGSIVSTYQSPVLLGSEERIITMETTEDPNRWLFIRERDTFELHNCVRRHP